MSTREEINAAFVAMVKSLGCPGCDRMFTDRALEWSDAWREGQADTLREVQLQSRDGETKIKCEFCGKKSWINYFAKTVALV